MEGFEEFLALRGVQRTLINRNTPFRYAHHNTRSQRQDTFDSSDDGSSLGEGDLIENISNDNEVQVDDDDDDDDDLVGESHYERDEAWFEDRVGIRLLNGTDYVQAAPPRLRESVIFGVHSVVLAGRDDFPRQFRLANELVEESSDDIRDASFEGDSEDTDSLYNSGGGNFNTVVESTPVTASSIISGSAMSQLGELDSKFKFTEKKSSSVRYRYPRLQDKTNFIYSPPVKEIEKDTFQVNIERNQKQFLLQQAPAEKFYNGLNLTAQGSIALNSVKDSMKYKNNLTCTFSHDGDYLVIAVESRLHIYDFDPMTNLPNRTPRLIFDTKPSFSSTTDRVVSTWPYFPHGINYIRNCQFLGKTVVCACIDDGRLLIWFVERFVEQMNQFESPIEQESFRNLTISPDFKVRLSASLWGLDIKENIIIASDNSQCVVLLFYHEHDGRFYHVKTHQILHNIPSVSIIKHTRKTVHVACASISGELVIFEFKLRLVAGPLNKSDLEFFQHRTIYYTDPMIESLEYGNGDDDGYRRWHQDLYNDVDLISNGKNVFKRIEFYTPTILSRCVLNEDCWTIQPFHSNWFLPVGSLQSVFGDSEIDEEKEHARIIAESDVLKWKQDRKSQKQVLDENENDGDFDNQTSLGVAAKYQFYKSNSIDFEGADDPVIRIPSSAKMTNVNDEYKRIHKDIVLREKVKNVTDDFMIVTTSKKIALFKYPTLYCPCATNPLFNLDLYRKADSCHSNRLSISVVIPELSCFIGVSQQGTVTIMRLCTSRGVYGMRQEHVFPNAFKMAPTDNGNYRSIVGLSVREKKSQVGANNGDCESVGEKDGSIYLLYILYDDGSLLGYTLRE
ncbi:Crt10 protein [Candida orthopsilosis Co 90-125]|uniref:Crt10 protein n=1 Tax=Candida orthopsilosis (strain 90-125) TaxID=1136231 RepID=H8X8E6_CANO9|nr:Crt10 protein [Candida orthopsilosis Co 90-125]CCG24421.1 Crt10 protein [Candida orthopsilosis Co 90-125]